jgi:hypothetical protein
MIYKSLGYAGPLSISSPRDVGMSPEKLERVRTAVQDLLHREKVAKAWSCYSRGRG